MTAAAESVILPMFPLGTVVMPGGLLPLHVFEPRYRALVPDVLAGDRRFGTVLIERGADVGGGDQRFGVGTIVGLAQAVRQPDGRWGIVVAGLHRMVIEQWMGEDPYPQARVRRDPDPVAVPAPDLLARAEAAVGRALTLSALLLGSDSAPGLGPISEGEDGVWQLADLAPLGDLDRQRVLEAPDADTRLRLLADLTAECADMLAHRLGEG